MGLRTAFRTGIQDGVSSEALRDFNNSVLTFTASVSVGALVSGQDKIVNVTMAGVLATDILVGISFRPASADVDIAYTANVLSANTVQLTAHHTAATTPTPTASTLLTVLVIRP